MQIHRVRSVEVAVLVVIPRLIAFRVMLGIIYPSLEESAVVSYAPHNVFHVLPQHCVYLVKKDTLLRHLQTFPQAAQLAPPVKYLWVASLAWLAHTTQLMDCFIA